MCNVIVLDRSKLIAQDVRDEIVSIAPDATVVTAATSKIAAQAAGQLNGIDLLVVSRQSRDDLKDSDLRELSDAARAILVLGERPDSARADRAFYVSDVPFSAASLRRDLLSINLDGGPLFPH